VTIQTWACKFNRVDFDLNTGEIKLIAFLALPFSCELTVTITVFADYLVCGIISYRYASILLVHWVFINWKYIETEWWPNYWTIYCAIWVDNFVDLLVIYREYEWAIICFKLTIKRFPALHSETPEDLASLRFYDCDCGSLIITESVELIRCPSVGAPSK
jgi:hypothetical protein